MVKIFKLNRNKDIMGYRPGLIQCDIGFVSDSHKKGVYVCVKHRYDHRCLDKRYTRDEILQQTLKYAIGV